MVVQDAVGQNAVQSGEVRLLLCGVREDFGLLVEGVPVVPNGRSRDCTECLSFERVGDAFQYKGSEHVQ